MNSREYMIENDIISHYYNIGIMGIILFVSPYAIIVLYGLGIIIKDIKSRLTIRGITYMWSIFITYTVGFFAGHVIDEYIITIYVAILAGLVVNYINSKKENIDERRDA